MLIYVNYSSRQRISSGIGPYIKFPTNFGMDLGCWPTIVATDESKDCWFKSISNILCACLLVKQLREFAVILFLQVLVPKNLTTGLDEATQLGGEATISIFGEVCTTHIIYGWYEYVDTPTIVQSELGSSDFWTSLSCLNPPKYRDWTSKTVANHHNK